MSILPSITVKPASIFGGAPDRGRSHRYAREDHDHGLPGLTTETIDPLLTGKENVANKVQVISEASTAQQYPSAAAVYAELQTVGEVGSGDLAEHAGLSTGVHGAGENSLVYSNDSRLTDSRPPTSHTQAESTLTFTDITTGDATTVQHGFLPKLGGGTTNFLRADGSWSEPEGGGGLTYSQILSMVSLRV